MATPSHAQAVKSLNKSPGRRRFVFKTFSQRLEEIEIDVFRSLDNVKSEPSEGSSFFRDCLIEWRELNTAEDFISFYEEMFPLVQTLPLVLLHKESILSKLLSRLQMKARLSLEPILRLTAALSRDILEDFLPFLPRIADSVVSLLKAGADREPEILEQIFTSWSYIMMYLQKYLVCNLGPVFKATQKLRYYPKDYVQEFMAEAVSFLLRSAPPDHLKEGIRKIMFEVAKKALPTKKYGVSALIFHVMRGAPSRFHSKAARVLRLLIDDSTFGIGDKFGKGSDTVLQVLTLTFQRLCEEIEPEELTLFWKCICEEITDSIKNECAMHLSNLLALLISTIQINEGRNVSDYQPILGIVTLLVEKLVLSSGTQKTEDNSDQGSRFVDEVLELMLCILIGLHNHNDQSTISRCSLLWAPVFKLKMSSLDLRLLIFIRKLLIQDPSIVYIFRANIISVLNDLIETSSEVLSYQISEEVVYVLLSFFERQHSEMKNLNFLDGISGEGFSKIKSFLQTGVCNLIKVINDIEAGNSSCIVHEKILALSWGIIRCIPHMFNIEGDSSFLIDLVDAADRVLMIEAGNFEGFPRNDLQSIIGVALSSYSKCYPSKGSGFEQTSKFLHLAKRHNSCSQVLLAVAEFLDSVCGPIVEADCNYRAYHPELKFDKIVDALNIFAGNLCCSDKSLRIATLRILCHYEPLMSDIEDEPVLKKLKTEAQQIIHSDSWSCNVLQLLLSLETTQISISTSRRVTLLISGLQMALSAGRVSKAYLPILMNGMISVFHNRFSYVWSPASECLAVLLSQHVGLVWEKFINYFEQCLSMFQALGDPYEKASAKLASQSSDLVELFNSFVTAVSDKTPTSSVLSLLLQSLQRIPTVVEARSRHIVPLFLKFLGYSCDNLVSVGSFNSLTCRGKEWKSVLKEWLNLLNLMRNLKSFYLSQFLRDVLQNRLLDDNDSEIQLKVLNCLVIWKDDFLLPYDQHLKNLVGFNSYREELTTWSLSREANLIEEHHRAHLLPIAIHLLMPKVRKLKKNTSRKHTSVNHRKAVLGFIAQLDVHELAPFFALLIKPLHIIPVESSGTSEWFWATEGSFNKFQPMDFLKHLTVEKITVLSWKKISGFLHVIEDIIGVFDEFRVGPFLDFLMGCVVRILKSCSINLEVAKSMGSSLAENHSDIDLKLKIDNTDMNICQKSSSLKQLKDLRSLCLKIVSLVLNNYEDQYFGCDFWDHFFPSVKPLIDGFRQESSSCEKPSSLFSCFVSMTRSRKLFPLLYREVSLIPDIFSILTVDSASEAIVMCVLDFIENLLNLGIECNEDVAVDSFLPNFEGLINSLHCFFQSDSVTKRKLVKRSGEKEIRIFKLLANHMQDRLLARKFMDIILPYLVKEAQNSDGFADVVQVIRNVLPVLGNDITTIILNAVSTLFLSIDRDKRLKLCCLLDALAEVDPSIHALAKRVRKLNSTSETELDDLDYDTILKAYAETDAEFFCRIQEKQALVILSHCVYDMSSGESTLRHGAYRSLVSFVEFSAIIIGEQDKSNEASLVNMATATGWMKESIHRITSKFLLKHMGNSMKEEAFIKRDWINLLREMVLKLPDVASLKSLKDLCDKDVETDFFNNINHMQKHRVARAVLRFRNVTKLGIMPEGLVKKVFIPLFFNMLFDAREGKGENIRNACIEAIASISGNMEWKSYYYLLIRCFREIDRHSDKHRALVRLICSILDHFHFSEVRKLGENASGTGTIDNGSLVILNRCSTFAMASEIQTCLHKVVLPKIQKLLNFDSDKVNINTSLAALKILKLLPEEVMDSQLSSIVHRISNFLKHRLESIRDEARSALAACLKELGLDYLQFIVRVLRATLKRGFELHVLGYTLNFILSKFLLSPVTGKLDYCLEDLLSVIEKDILGEVAEEKEVEKIASKMKETRQRKSFDTLKLIAQSITFRTHALKLLAPVISHLRKHLTPKLKTKLESMLSHIAAGIECNPSVDEADLFIFIHNLIADGFKNEKCKNDPSTAGDNEIGGKSISSTMVIGGMQLGSYLFMVFALGILHKRLKNVKMSKNDEKLASMLQPFVPLLCDCLNSKYEDVISTSLRCLTPLLKLSLSSVESHGDKTKIVLLDIAQRTVNTSSSLMQSCLQLLTMLLRSKKVTLSSQELQLLFQFPLFVDLERNPSFVALSLLKAVVNKRVVIHEIYDLAIRVAELMVTNQEEPIRQKCSQILLQFLLNYPLSQKRLQQHLDFLLSNLRYEHASGRKAVLEMLHAIIVKFPKNVVDEQAHTLFVYLVLCLANDQDNEVRLMAGTAIKRLIGCIDHHSLIPILDSTISWYLGEEQQRWCAAAQVLGLLVEVMKKGFQRHIKSILPVAGKILHAAVNAVTYWSLKFSQEDAVPFWKEAYYSLIMFEKLLYQFQNLCFERDLQYIWEAIVDLLLHPHMWLRNISSRLVSVYFSAATISSRENHEKPVQLYFLMHPSRLFMIAISFCCQLKTKLDDDSVNNLIMRNLVFAVSGLSSVMGQLEHAEVHKFWSALEKQEQGCFMKALQLLESKTGQNMLRSLTSGKSEEKHEGHSKNIRNLLVSSLLKQMGKIAFQGEDVQMKIVFNSFREISSQIAEDDRRLFAFDIMIPLYKVCEGFAGKMISDDVKQLAVDICECLRKTLGTTFEQVYGEIRKYLKVKRDKRKQEIKLMAVVNPMRNATRKLRIAAKHRANKRKKNAGTHGAYKRRKLLA